jgi:hypothetical protein
LGLQVDEPTLSDDDGAIYAPRLTETISRGKRVAKALGAQIHFGVPVSSPVRYGYTGRDSLAIGTAETTARLNKDE